MKINTKILIRSVTAAIIAASPNAAVAEEQSEQSKKHHEAVIPDNHAEYLKKHHGGTLPEGHAEYLKNHHGGAIPEGCPLHATGGQTIPEGCPMHAATVSTKPKGAAGHGSVSPGQAKKNQFWWPNQLDLSSLRDHDSRSNPLGINFNYQKAFLKLDLEAVKKDINTTLTDSQDWWPADWGHYGPLFIRMTWHSAGTYRTLDGRGGASGGQQRFDPLNSWPDNGNLDKARRLLWPVKKKYGENLSWADLMVLAGNVALENMGFPTYGFAGGRDDDWEPDLVYWGPEVEMLASDRHEKDGTLQRPLGATHMGLIYVNPEGPGGVPDPLASAKNIRTAFSRMAMNDEETVALIAGGHTFGKMHGAHKPAGNVGAEPAGSPVEDQGFVYLSNLMNFEWKQTKSPAGAIQWIPENEALHKSVADAHVEGKFNSIVMLTTDLALKADPEYRKVVESFLADPEKYKTAFGKAWFKLTHRDMGPAINFLGKETQELVRTSWSSAASFRGTDLRGGANGARIALAPQKDWAINNPAELQKVVEQLQSIQAAFNKTAGDTQVSLADLIILGGAAAIEKAAKDGGVEVNVPFVPGRGDTTQELTDVTSFSLLEPKADAFRNYYSKDSYLSPTAALVDTADKLNLTVPEMTVLLGGMRSLGALTSLVAYLTTSLLTYSICQRSGKNQRKMAYTKV